MKFLNKLNAMVEDLSLKRKVLLFFGLMIVIPSLCNHAIFFKDAYERALDEEQKRISQTLKLLTNNIDMQLTGYQNLLDGVYEYPDIFTVLKQFNEVGSNNDETGVENVLNSIKTKNTNIGCVSYITPGGREAISTTSYVTISDFNRYIKENKDKYINDMKDGFQFVWTAPIGTADGERFVNNNTFVSCRKYVRDFGDKMNPLGIITEYINVDFMDGICRDVSISENGIFMVLDDRSQVIWHPNRKMLAKDISQYGFKEIDKYSGGFIQRAKLNNDNYYFIVERLEKTGWMLLAIVPQRDIFEKLVYLIPYFAIIFLAIAIFTVVCYLLLDRYVVSVIHRLILLMDTNFKDGTINNSIGCKIERNDEIGALYRTFKAMSIRISNLITDIRATGEITRDKDIQILKSRMNVHFLYNTLDTVNWMAIKINAGEISNAIKSLIGILRYSISTQTEHTTFLQEIDHLKSYLDIQKLRFEERFSVSYDIDNSLLNCKTVKLIFQPLVENSIHHGFKNLESDGLIQIRLFKENDVIVGQVIDNGCGMEQETIDEVMSNRRTKQGIGIFALRESIRLIYGEPYGLDISSLPGRGTTITVKLPGRQGNKRPDTALDKE